MKNRFSQITISIWKKTALVFLGLILSLVLLEVGMRLGGSVLLSIQEYGNLRSLKQKGAYRILCLGESTTRGEYPEPLEQVLNRRHIGVRFSVIDGGIEGTGTNGILSRVESYLAEYHPDMVVAMMGINDRGVKYYEDIRESDTWLFKHCRVYRFGRLLVMHLLKKIKREGIYGLSGSDSDKKAKPEDIGTENDNAFPEADDSFKKAIEINPKDDNAYAKLGRLYKNQGKFTQAEESFKKVVELNPKNDRAYVALGDLYMKQGKLSESEDSFKKAIGINPKNDNAYVELGRIYHFQGALRLTEDTLRKAVEINPKNDTAYVGLGRVYQAYGKFSEAEDLFKKAVELNPENYKANLSLGWFYRKQGKLSQAENIFKKGLELDPKNELILAAMATVCEEMGKPEMAKEYAEKAHQVGLGDNAALTVKNYRELKEILDRKGIKLVCMQYPMRHVDSLKKIFEKDEGVIFIDNERVFKEAIKQSSYKEFFVDMFGGDFGHCTPKGNELLAQNIADVILREVFNKQ
jgi:tetratricopeptide (TPR) repeat protein